MRSLLALRCYFFFSFGTVGLYVPYFPSWLLSRGFRGAELSAFVALPPVASLLAPTLIGMLSDRLGLRGRFIALASGLASLAMGLLAWFATSATRPAAPMLAAFALFSFARAPMLSLGDVLAIENDPHYGRTRLWGSLGFIANASLGGVVLNSQIPELLPLAIGAGALVSLGLSFALPQTSALPPRPALDDAKTLLADPQFRRFLSMAALAYAALSAYDFASTLRLTELGASGPLVGVFWATATSAEVILLFFGRRVTALFGVDKVLVFALACGAVRWLLMATLDQPWLLVLIQPLHAVVFGLFLLASVELLKRKTASLGVGTGQGLLSLGTSSGATLGLASWGSLHALYGSASVFWVASGLSLVALALSLGASPRGVQPIRETA